MEIYLIRHTTPDVPRGTSYGQTDVFLKSTFPEELEAVRCKLEGLTGLTYYSSPLQRCTRLASGLSGSPPHIDRRLMEIDFGDWEMKFWEGGDTLSVLKGIILEPAPGGESYAQVQERAISFLDELAGQSHERAAVVTHAGVIRAVLAHVFRMPLTNLFSIVPSLGGVARIDVNGADRRLLFFNR